MPAYLEGMAYGLVFVFSFGPSFLALMQTAMKVGVKRAVMVSLGVNMSDAVWLTIILLGLGALLETSLVKQWMGWVGVIVLLVFGLASLFKTSVKVDGEVEEAKPYYLYFLKGMALNGLNPLIAFFWVGVVGTVSSFGYTKFGLFAFFGGFLNTVILVDTFKALLIRQLSGKITPKMIKRVNQALGGIFIFFSIRLSVYLMSGW